MSNSLTIQEIASAIGGEPSSGLDPSQAIRNVAALAAADEHAISWVDGPKWQSAAATSKAAALITTADVGGDLSNRIVVADVQSAVADLLALFADVEDPPEPGIHPTAVIESGAEIAPSAHIGPHCLVRAGARIGERSILVASVNIGRNVIIGCDCYLRDHVVIHDRCILGDRVAVHATSVIGADGFGYIFRNGQHRKLRHIGTVVIEDDVEIGASTTIDRAKVGETRIGRGTKIDNQVQVAHNVNIGPLSILVGQVGLSGSVRLGAGCVLGGQVGVTDGLHLADGTRVAAKSAVMNSFTEPNQTLMGIPAQDHMAHKRELIRARRLPQLNERVVALEKKVASLEGATDH